jgi:hypothetical protein
MITVIVKDLHEVERIYQEGEEREFGNPLFDVVVFAESSGKTSKGITNRNGETQIDVDLGDKITLRVISKYHQVFDNEIVVGNDPLVVTLADDEC